MAVWTQNPPNLLPTEHPLPARPVAGRSASSSHDANFTSNSYAHSSSAYTNLPYLNMSNYHQSPYGSTAPPYTAQQAGYSSTPPVIQNPFPLPGTEPAGFGRPGYDPEYEAQVAQWQSAYIAKDDGVTGKPVSRPTPTTVTDNTSTDAHTNANGTREGKALTVVRHGGGKVWEDPSLIEWGDDPRLFIGNLAGEVTDDSLLKAFAKYNPVKARVIRDKRTTKSKGFGFVSFKTHDDFFQAAKEMVGKYIGSHPVTITRAGKIATASTVRDNKNGRRDRHQNTRGGNANTGAGVHKTQKPKGGPKLLG